MTTTSKGVAPSFVGNLSDETGRRPVLLIALLIYIAGCVGAALKANYALLFVRRCLQRAGSSGTVALSRATVSDIVTSAERGRYTSYVQMGWMLGPPFAFSAAFLPETSRDIVGNGSISPPRWNLTLHGYLGHATQKTKAKTPIDLQLDSVPKRASVNPLNSLKLFRDKETCILLLYSGLIYANSYMVLSTLPDQLEEGYGFDTFQISLCFLASGFGSMASVTLTGRLIDWNFRRHARLVGMEISNQKQQDLSRFPIEIARLKISIPALILAGASLIAYRWTLQARTHLAALLIFLFL
ncbi:putative Major facilitator superfamily (MFS) profile domain-containing protein [Seiridium cardinale]